MAEAVAERTEPLVIVSEVAASTFPSVGSTPASLSCADAVAVPPKYVSKVKLYGGMP